VGLTSARSGWAAEVSRWCTGGVVAADFATCLTADELRATLALRPVDVVILDAALAPGAPSLLHEVRARGASVVGVDAGDHHDPAAAEHFDAMLAVGFTPRALTDLLQRLEGDHAALHAAGARAGAIHQPLGEARRLRARTIGVSGIAGAGASVVAMALAQGLAGGEETVALLDGARRAQLAMYHDVGDVVPGLAELVDAQLGGIADPAEVRSLLFDLPERGYQLLLGQRRPDEAVRHGTAALTAALDALARSYDLVVVDHDPDVDLGPPGARGALRERHAVALHTVATAEIEVLVARPGTKGLHDAARRLDELIEAGMPPERLVVCCNRSPRAATARSGFDRSVRALTRGRFGDGTTLEVLHLGASRGIERALSDGRALPARPAAALAGAVRRRLDSLGRRGSDPAERRDLRSHLESPLQDGALPDPVVSGGIP
jgi:hypothetical protein